MDPKVKWFLIGWTVGGAAVGGLTLLGTHFIILEMESRQICPEPQVLVQKQKQPCDECDCPGSMSCKDSADFLSQELSWRTRDLSSCIDIACDNGVPEKVWLTVDWWTPELREGQAKKLNRCPSNG